MFWYMDISFEDNEIVILKNGQCSMIFIGIGVYISIWNDLICLCASVHISAATSIPVLLKDESDIIVGSRNDKIFYKYLRDISLGWSLHMLLGEKVTSMASMVMMKNITTGQMLTALMNLFYYV